MLALGEQTVNQREHEIVCKHVIHGQGSEGLILRACLQGERVTLVLRLPLQAG